ncbi:MAG: Nif3-like dinuclear metal center hexameric protein [Atribacterota bacterium]
MEPLRNVTELLENLFPSSLALSDDRVGLQVQAKNTVEKILVALELSPQVVRKALESSCDFLYLHHPPLWEPLQRLSCEDPLFVMLEKLYAQGVSVFAHHTNLDIAPQGIADQWLKLLDLEKMAKPKPLFPVPHAKKYKLVTFVPQTHLNAVLEALFLEGAGIIGKYRDCAFFTLGTGTFRPEEAAHPFIGKPGQQEVVEEARVEIEVSSGKLYRAIEALLKAHPYEQPVVDVYQLIPGFEATGLGRVVTLPNPLSPKEIQERFSHLSVPFNLLCEEKDKTFQKIALCPGSGRKLIPKVIEEQVDLFISGDLTHHDIERLRLLGIAYLHVPHGPGERRALREIVPLLEKEVQKRKLKVDILFEEEIP